MANLFIYQMRNHFANLSINEELCRENQINAIHDYCC